MSKYIDAEKLKADIERLKEETFIGICEYDKGQENGRMEVLTSLQSTIDSLQQEQLPGIEEHGVPGKDFIPVEWVDACEKYGKWKIVQQQQPSLPSNLDEAAREIVIKMHPCLKDCTILGDRLTRGQLMALVKAGAEWMANRRMNK